MLPTVPRETGLALHLPHRANRYRFHHRIFGRINSETNRSGYGFRSHVICGIMIVSVLLQNVLHIVIDSPGVDRGYPNASELEINSRYRDIS